MGIYSSCYDGCWQLVAILVAHAYGNHQGGYIISPGCQVVIISLKE